jgi:hypothetical protein
MVADGRMPGPIQIDGRKIWDLRAVDAAFDALAGVPQVNPWDVALALRHAEKEADERSYTERKAAWARDQAAREVRRRGKYGK